MSSSDVLAPADHAPSAAQLRTFGVLAFLYAAFTALLVPWAGEAGPADARIVVVYGGAILVADACTAALLAARYRVGGRPALLVLACAFFYGALMAGAHMATYPGALAPQGLLGGEHGMPLLLIAWRIGAVALIVAAVLAAGRGAPSHAERRDARLLAGLLLTAAAVVVLAVLATRLPTPAALAERLGGLYSATYWGALALYAAAFLYLWIRRAFGEELYLWLGLALAATMAGLVLAGLSGAEFTIGWHASRAHFVFAACLMLAFLLGDASAGERRLPRAATYAAYGGAVSVTLAAVLLRWMLEPWLGDEVPFVTLYGAVAIAVWFGGLGPAVLSMVVGYAIVNVRYISPTGELAVATPLDALALALFALSSSLVIVLGEAMRRARDRHRASEAEVKARARELQRADETKSRFLAVLAHELRNPLAPLRTGLALMRLKHADPAAVETQDMMERQIAQLSRLIDDLLDLSRIDRGKLELRMQTVEVGAILRTAIDTARPNIDAQAHQLVVRYPQEKLYVEGDMVRLAQVVSNLLNNAAKFTPPGGRIELSAGAADGSLELRVADNGIGIAPERLNEVFEMFVQLDGTRTRMGGGLGLGLTLARSIVQQHGGTLTAHSAGPGQGSEFVARLPLVAARVEPTVEPADAAEASTSRRRVLVVDDNVDAAQTLAEYLRLLGHRAESALDGEAALRIAEVLQPDVAFIDLNMPRMDGAEVARRLRATPWGRSARLIALTGMGQQSDIEKTREAGFDEHLTKPADLRDVSRLASGELHHA